MRSLDNEIRETTLKVVNDLLTKPLIPCAFTDALQDDFRAHRREFLAFLMSLDTPTKTAAFINREAMVRVANRPTEAINRFQFSLDQVESNK